MERVIHISIIIPSFNREELIKETLESVLGQTYEYWECIVVDDGSTDLTWKVLEGYANKDSRIKILKRNREPKGAPTCRNIGANLSRGKYLVFWDSDDIMAPWCIEERVVFMDANQDLDFGLFQIFYLTNNKFTTLIDVEEKDLLKGFLSFSYNWGTPALIWRKTFYYSLEGWNEKAKIWQDPELYIRVLLKKPKFKWGSKVPSGIVRCDLDKHSISNGSKKVVLLLNRIAVMCDVMPLLKTYYRGVFEKGVKTIIWFSTYEFDWNDKCTIIKYASNNGVISKKESIKYQCIFYMYKFMSKIPFIKGVYYRLLIRPNFKGYKSNKNKFLDIKLEEEFLKKTLSIKDSSGFKELVLKALINE